MTEEEKLMFQRKREDVLKENERLKHCKGIFDGLVIYINGSTYPLVSDHKLKHILADNGARLSIHLGRRQVTHVILGKPCGTGFGAGGGLAGMKIEKEIRRIGGCGVKYVSVEWQVTSTPAIFITLTDSYRVLESMKAGKRLPEAQFSNLKVAAKGQQSVYGMFEKTRRTTSSEGAGREAEESYNEPSIIR